MILPRVLLLFTTAIPLTSGQNVQGCVNNVQNNRDYFPDKVSPSNDALWDITYFDTYKVLTDRSSLQEYLLYQCGTNPPTDGFYAGVFEVPVTSVALAHIPAAAALQELGINQVDYFLLDADAAGDPCLARDIQQGNTDVTEESQVTNTNRFVAFTSPFFFSFVPNALISDIFQENSAEAAYEWVKYYSAFFNLEARANRVVRTAQEHVQCTADNAAATADFVGGQNPTIAWITYNSFCNGWLVASCPGPECDFATTCAADIVEDPDNGSVNCPGRNLLTTQQMVNTLANVDYLIYDGQGQNQWSDAYTGSRQNLMRAGLSAVTNQQVYDYENQGYDVFQAQRLSRYYEIVQEVCFILDRTTFPANSQGYLRNVFTESVGNGGTCQGGDKSSLRYEDCEDTSLVPDEPAPVAAPVPAPVLAPVEAPVLAPVEAPVEEQPVQAPVEVTNAPFSTDGCQDAPPSVLFFVNSNVGEQNCEWLETQPGTQRRLCSEGFDAFTLCPVTCENCVDDATVFPTPPPVSTASPTVTPTALPTTSPVADPTTNPTTAPPTMSPTVPPTTPPTTPPTDGVPVEIPVEEPIEEPVAAPVEEPVEVPVEVPVEEPVEEPEEAPVEVPLEEPVEEPVEPPLEVPPVEAPVEEPVEEPVALPVEEPVEDPVDEPTTVETPSPLSVNDNDFPFPPEPVNSSVSRRTSGLALLVLLGCGILLQ